MHNMILEDRRTKVPEIPNAVWISRERAGYIFHAKFRMKILSKMGVAHAHFTAFYEKQNVICSLVCKNG